jgi:hypothetical protein
MMKAPAARWIAASLVAACAADAAAQNGPVPAARVNVLLAEDRRAATPRDLVTLRNAARGRDAETARLAIRALGRLEQPALIEELLPAISASLPEIRAEAVNAIGQAAHGWVGTTQGPRDELTPGSVLAVLVERLAVEQEPAVRAVLCETIGRLPYRSVDEATTAEAALVAHAAASDTISDRLGLAKGIEAFLRANRTVRPPGGSAVALARALLGLPDPAAALTGSHSPAPFRTGSPSSTKHSCRSRCRDSSILSSYRSGHRAGSSGCRPICCCLRSSCSRCAGPGGVPGR